MSSCSTGSSTSGRRSSSSGSVRSTRPLERCAVAGGEVRRGLVGALQEGEQGRVRIVARAYRLVRQHELAEPAIEARAGRPYGDVAEALRLGIGVRVEDRFRKG